MYHHIRRKSAVRRLIGDAIRWVERRFGLGTPSGFWLLHLDQWLLQLERACSKKA
jgi:hypothetical protein